jgi:AraC family transcriptional regulator
MHSQASDSDILHAQKAGDVLGGMRPLTSSANADWNGLLIESYQISKLGPTPRFCYSDRHVISVQREGIVEVHEAKLHRKLYPDAIAVCPADAPQSSFTFSNARMVVAMLDPAFMRRAVGNAINADIVEILSRIPVRDEQLDHLVRAAEIEIRLGLPSGRVFLESLGTAMAVRLLTHHASKPVTPRHYGNTMPKHLLRRTIDYIRENLSEDISLATLSSDVGMSKYHFCHMFKRSTGLSPHQFVKRARVERAQVLLADHRLSLVEIAHELGFSDQSHFTRTFHAVVGVTPSQYVSGT